MNRIPLQTDIIPAGTGLVQSVECKGVRYSESGFSEVLENPVVAQIVTYANGIRRVCCLHALNYGNDGGVKCYSGGREQKTNCIYGWDDPEKE